MKLLLNIKKDLFRWLIEVDAEEGIVRRIKKQRIMLH